MNIKILIMTLAILCGFIPIAHGMEALTRAEFEQTWQKIAQRFITIDAKNLKTIVSRKPHDPTWGCGQTQCWRLIRFAHLHQSHPMKTNLAVENLLGFKAYAHPKTLAEFINQHLPQEYPYHAQAKSYGWLYNHTFLAEIKSGIKQGTPLLAYYLASTTRGKRLQLAIIAGYQEREDKFARLLLLVSADQGVRICTKTTDELINDMNLENVIHSFAKEGSELKDKQELFKNFFADLEPFNFIVLSDPSQEKTTTAVHGLPDSPYSIVLRNGLLH